MGRFSTGSGFYFVNFPRDVTTCAIVATARQTPTSSNGLSIDVENESVLTGGGARVYIEIWRGYEAITGFTAKLDAAFSVVATCP